MSDDLRIAPDACCFVDTNVWLYAFIRTANEEKLQIAQTVITGGEIILSTQVINEICVNLLKKAGFSESRLSSLILSLYKKYTVFDFSEDILLQASEIRKNFQFSFWDSLIGATALESEADFLISEDMQHGFKLNDRLVIVNPFRP
ncbi:MAG: PIN domain-containing protein [Thermodesulfobacteriota bacterium]|nr:PIN domain-containing protein [Thermodesulfobacteriota bacterium]